MSTLDRQPRISSTRSGPLCEPRVDPGAVPMKRANQPQKMAAKLPRGVDMTKAPKQIPVKR